MYISQIIWSGLWFDLMEMFAGKAKNTYFDCSNNCGDFCHCELVKFILTILKRNILQLKLWTNVNAYAQMYFAAKLAFNLSNENRPLQRPLPWIYFTHQTGQVLKKKWLRHWVFSRYLPMELILLFKMFLKYY